MFAVTVLFAIKPECIDDFMPLMHANARRSLQEEPECHQFDVCRGSDPCQVFLYEIYTDRAAFDLHLASDHFQAFDKAVSAMVASKSVQLFEEVTQ